MFTTDFRSLLWLDSAPVHDFRGTELFVTTGLETDFWRETFYDFRKDDGHFMYKAVTGDFSVEVTVAGHFESLYDQAGLMLRLSESAWIKAGLELTDGALHFSVVVTNDKSDWSLLRLPVEDPSVRLRMTRHSDAVRVQYLDRSDSRWKPARLTYFPFHKSIDVGVMCCSPKRAGLEVTFQDLLIGEPVSRDLHN